MTGGDGLTKMDTGIDIHPMHLKYIQCTSQEHRLHSLRIPGDRLSEERESDYAAQKQKDCQIASQAEHKKSSRELGKVA